MTSILKFGDLKIEDPTAIAMGVFDGVHLGHQLLISQMIDFAKRKALKKFILTFDPHPATILKPKLDFKVLTSTASKLEILRSYDIDGIVIVDFNKERASQSAEDFLDELRRKINLRSIHVGQDFTFGVDRSGDTKFLKTYMEKSGVCVDIVALLLDTNGEKISSSRIRELISKGELALANKLLGRRYFVSGVVISGAGRGKKLGFPTANLKLADELLLIREGIYAGYAYLENECNGIMTAISVGKNETFSKNGQLSIEAHLIDFGKTIYGKTLKLEFDSFIRPQVKFKTVNSLCDQMRHDVEQVKAILGSI